MKKLSGYLRLMRPANIVTAIADVLAGIAISGFMIIWAFDIPHIFPLILLCISTAGLYGGGVVFNDVFDAKLDKTERPERPIPSGLIHLNEAIAWGCLLLLAGIISAMLVQVTAAVLAILITAAAWLYNKWGKHKTYIGPLNMGLCRGLNLLLGLSILPHALEDLWYIAFVPVMYIAAITMISRGEVHGSNRKPLYSAFVLYTLVIVLIFAFALLTNRAVFAAVFLIAFAWMIFRPLLAAIKQPSGPNIGKAVKGGIIALILMDAAWASASGSVILALTIVLLLPLSIWLSGLFAVT